MQSLYQSVGHESRNHNSYENGINVPIESVVRESVHESTPLMNTRIPQERGSIWTLVFIVLMILMLVSGVIIGSYLLAEQNKPLPMNIPFTLVTRDNWNARKPKSQFLALTTNPADQLLVLQTSSKYCFSKDSCQSILQQIQETYQNDNNTIDLPFNFLVGGNGITYEGRGYDVIGDVDPKYDNSSITLAFVGNFKNKDPTKKQMDETQAFIFNSIKTRKLISNYKVIFKCTDNCTALYNLWHKYFKFE